MPLDRRRIPGLKEDRIRMRLPEGPTVCILHRRGARRHTAMAAVPFGSLTLALPPPPGSPGATHPIPPGLAHFLEHQLFQKPEGDLSETFASLGASCNAATDFPATAYFFSGTRNFEASLETLMDLVSRAHFAPEAVAREREIIGQELKMYEDIPERRLLQDVLEALYREHPVRHDIGGSLESVARITPELLSRSFEAFYHPAHLFLGIVGDVDPAAVTRVWDRARRATGPPGPPPPLPPPESGPVAVPRRERSMPVSRPRVLVGLKDDPPAREAMLDTEITLEVALEILFGAASDFHERHYRDGLLDDSFQYFASVHTTYACVFIGGDTPDPDRLARMITEELHLRGRDGFPRRRFLRAHRNLHGRFLARRDYPEETAFELLAAHMRGTTDTDYLTRLRRISRRDIQAHIRILADPSRQAVGVVSPA